MKPLKYLSRLIMLAFCMTLVTGCVGWNTQQRDTAIGAVGGGVAGAALGGGPLGTLGGAAVGGFIGHEVGK